VTLRFPYTAPSCGRNSVSHLSQKLLIDFPIQHPVLVVTVLAMCLTNFSYIFLYSTQLWVSQVTRRFPYTTPSRNSDIVSHLSHKLHESYFPVHHPFVAVTVLAICLTNSAVSLYQWVTHQSPAPSNWKWRCAFFPSVYKWRLFYRVPEHSSFIA
jgi:hypothetical protein